MRNIAIALTLLLTAGCSDAGPAEDEIAGTSGEASTGAAVDTDEDGESSSGGNDIEEWPGNILADVRMVSTQGETCVAACGASACVEALSPDFPDLELGCNEATAADNTECTCADFTEEIDDRTTHAFSPCYLNPNSGSTQAVDPPKWDQGTCDDFCGRFGYTCAGTIWGFAKECPNVRGEWPNLYEDGPVTRPADLNGPDGVFVAVCEL